MRQELQLELQSQFAFMKRDMSLGNRYQNYGCECGDGWFELIQELCQRITNVYKFEGIDDIDIEILQIKEKFGKLRFYYRHFGDSNTIQAIDFLGVGSLRLSPPSDEECEYKKKISELVHSYEEWSSHICEKCGGRGALRTDFVWKKTLCEDCYQEMIESN
jgi:hypothetical protein